MNGPKRAADDMTRMRTIETNWAADAYLKDLDLHESAIPYAMLTAQREKWNFLPTVAAVNQADESHRRCLMAFKEIAKALAQASGQWRSNLGALRKAQKLEAQEKEKEDVFRLELIVTCMRSLVHCFMLYFRIWVCLAGLIASYS